MPVDSFRIPDCGCLVRVPFTYVVIQYHDVKDFPFQPMVIRDFDPQKLFHGKSYDEKPSLSGKGTTVFKSGFQSFQTAQEEANRLNDVYRRTHV